MFPISWLRMRSVLLVEILLLGGGTLICSIIGGSLLLLAAGWGLFFSLILLVTLLSLRVEAADAKADYYDLRRQRHDLLNHLQVVYGLLQLGKTERALEYIADMLGDGPGHEG